MKALTIRQPWAHAILRLGKDVENRSWRPPRTLIGEYIAIHASKQFDEKARVAIDREAVAFGAIVGVAKLAAVVTHHGSKWFAGDYGWLLTDVRELPEPIACGGQLRLWDVPAAELRSIRSVFPDLHL